MPELPEIAHLLRSLEPVLPGAVVRRVQLLRRDIVRAPESRSRLAVASVSPASLLAGQQIRSLDRHGKELAIVAQDGRTVCVHLGMSGQLVYCPPYRRLPRADHVHCVWQLESGGTRGRLVFRDPRRFGGLWTYPSLEALRAARWSKLGPDALSIDTRTLRARLSVTRRVIKTALLDQRLVAGIGNIYADEILFAARIHPRSVSSAIPPAECRRLARSIRTVLRQAIESGGSTIRDYVDGRGESGGYVRHHRVYGRRGQACVWCGDSLRAITVSQRTTVFCRSCQGLFSGTKAY